MSQSYSQFRAMMAISKGQFAGDSQKSLCSYFQSGFPIVFILVFGFIGGGGTSVSVALKNPAGQFKLCYTCTACSASYGFKKNEKGNALTPDDSVFMRNELVKGRIAAIVSLDSSRSPAGFTQYKIITQTSSASADQYPILRMAMAQTIQIIEEGKFRISLN